MDFKIVKDDLNKRFSDQQMLINDLQQKLAEANGELIKLSGAYREIEALEKKETEVKPDN